MNNDTVIDNLYSMLRILRKEGWVRGHFQRPKLGYCVMGAAHETLARAQSIPMPIVALSGITTVVYHDELGALSYAARMLNPRIEIIAPNLPSAGYITHYNDLAPDFGAIEDLFARAISYAGAADPSLVAAR